MISIGTSGYSYAEWKGSFYPKGMKPAEMLPYYADRMSTVEINNTFYRFPTEKVLTDWSGATPEEFTFTLKASRRMTHFAKLKDCSELLQNFCERAQTLGPKLGILLFQLPPYLRKDLDVFDEFLGAMPDGVRAAFEFRHSSWLSDDVYERLAAKNLALCIADSEDDTTPVEVTADYGYLRLRDEGYQQSDIEHWADVIVERKEDWKDTFVYFKHEEAGAGPEFARALGDALSGR
jgi:uncharacterized protein YecE (DUF72 family)